MDGYNWVYSKLVSSDDDLVGMIAYSLYKNQKIEWIKQCENETGNPPTDEQIAEFHRVSMLPSSLERYHTDANRLLMSFLSLSTEGVIAELYAEQKQMIYHELTGLLSPIQDEIAKKRSWRQILFEAVVSVIGTVVVFILVGLLLKGYQLISSVTPTP